MKEGTFLRRMHPVLTPKLYFRISMIFYTALSTRSFNIIVNVGNHFSPRGLYGPDPIIRLCGKVPHP